MALFKDKKISEKKEGIKISIFIKLLLIFLGVSIIPAVASFFLTASTYQKIIETGIIQEYLGPHRGEPEVEKELFLAQKNIRVQAALLLLLVIYQMAYILPAIPFLDEIQNYLIQLLVFQFPELVFFLLFL